MERALVSQRAYMVLINCNSSRHESLPFSVDCNHKYYFSLRTYFLSKSIEFNLHVKVGDFGLTRKFTQLPMTPGPGLSTMPGNMEQVMNKDSDFTTSVGTAIYASPEQLFTFGLQLQGQRLESGVKQ